jgi:hypothetical protein
MDLRNVFLSHWRGKKCRMIIEREVYLSSNGDRWLLVLPGANAPVVEHRPNVASNGATTQIAVETFLCPNNEGPEHQALRKMLADSAKLGLDDHSW